MESIESIESIKSSESMDVTGPNSRRREAALGKTLEDLYLRFGAELVGTDPLVLVRRYTRSEDIEAAGWIASAFAYGRVEMILSNVGKLLGILGGSPARTLAGNRFTAGDLPFFRHRFHGPGEAAALLNVIGETIRREGSVGDFFQRRFERKDQTTGPMLDRLTAEILGSLAQTTPPLRFLFPAPSDGSACKRWNMFLRWMVRREGMDFGLWRKIPPRALVMPVDTHVHRVARRLRLTRRKSADWKTAEEITGRLARFDPDDPVKYDFALCRLGILEICRTQPRLSDCPHCPAQRVCPVGQRRISRTTKAA